MLTTTAADEMLRTAFPRGAVYERPTTDDRWVALEYHAVDGTTAGDTIEVRFERDPGDTLQRVSRADLVEAAGTGQLRCNDGVTFRQPRADDCALLGEPFETLVGWQSKSDGEWPARMRLHQSWWRAFRLRVPFGTGPTSGSHRRYGNMLDASSGDAGLNFLSTSRHSPSCCAIRRRASR